MGGLVTEKENINIKITERLSTGNSYYALHPILQLRAVSHIIMLRTYWMAVMDAAQTLHFGIKQVNVLATWEGKKILKRFLDPWRKILNGDPELPVSLETYIIN